MRYWQIYPGIWRRKEGGFCELYFRFSEPWCGLDGMDFTVFNLFKRALLVCYFLKWVIAGTVYDDADSWQTLRVFSSFLLGAGAETLLTSLGFILLYHSNSYAITTASGHRPVVQYVLGVASVIHLLHGMVSLFLSPKGNFKMDLLIHLNLT